MSLSLRREPAGPEIALERVQDDDLSEVVSEAWRDGYLRHGRCSVPPDDLARAIVPIARGSGPGYGGFAVETEDSRGLRARCEFSALSLQHVASRAAERLVRNGVLDEGDLYFYEVVPERGLTPEVSSGPEDELFTVTAPARSLRVAAVPLRPLLQSATSVGDPGGDAYPVFYTEDALREAERVSRRGATQASPVESGGVLIGPLCSCPDTGELFAVVCAVLEATDARHDRFSLHYSSRTWSRIQTVVAAMQREQGAREYRIIGQCHGHPFLPDGGAEPCAACESLEVCGRTSVFVSSDDERWSRAVFAGQPWKLCHIYGWNARREPVHGLFGLRDGRLLQRPFYVIPSFQPPRMVRPDVVAEPESAKDRETELCNCRSR